MRCIKTDTPPELTERDKVVRKDLAWLAAAEVYLDLKRQAESLNALFDEAKEKLVGLVSHPSESGAGVTVTQFWKQGSVDYKKVPELTAVDLEAYRGKGREEVRVAVVKLQR